MPSRPKKPREPAIVAAVSGGPDSVYLLRKLSSDKGTRIVLGHVNYGTRGIDSVKDQKLVEMMGKSYGYPTIILAPDRAGAVRDSKGGSGTRGRFPAGSRRRPGRSDTGF